MAAHSDFPAVIPFRTLRVPGAVWGGLALAVLVGVVGAFLGGHEHGRVWHALHFNWLFWSSVAIGMVVLSLALHITNARWAWSVRRFASAGAAFLPVSLLLFPVVFWGGYENFFEHWLHAENDPIIEAKRAWLSVGGMFTRDLLALVVLFGLALWFTYHTLRPDLFGARGSGVYGLFTRGSRGDAAEEAVRSRRIMNPLAPITALLFALLWGLIAIDQGMTMLPHFFSTMFPVAFLVSSFHSAIAMTALMAVVVRGQERLHDYVTPRQFHDLGKLLFAFAVFWMYINWSQFVVIWYGLLPHEQEYFVQRFQAPFGGVTELMVGCVFVIPFFFLLTRPPKQVPLFLAFVAVIVLFGHWLERFLITVPSVWTDAAHLPLGLTEVGVALGFGGVFFACYLWFMATFPILPSPVSLAASPRALVTIPGPPKIAEV